MPYIDFDYYTNTYQGSPVDEDAFPRLAQRASEVIDSVTQYRIRDIDKLPPFFQKQVKNATAAQVEFYQVNGGYEALIEQDFSNVRIGNFNYGGNGSGGGSSISADDCSKKVFDFLEPTGLLYRGVHTRG